MLSVDAGDRRSVAGGDFEDGDLSVGVGDERDARSLALPRAVACALVEVEARHGAVSLLDLERRVAARGRVVCRNDLAGGHRNGRRRHDGNRPEPL